MQLTGGLMAAILNQARVLATVEIVKNFPTDSNFG
jgi:hypothetical protein